jgi:hypothetical protein
MPFLINKLLSQVKYSFHLIRSSYVNFIDIETYKCKIDSVSFGLQRF